MADDPDRAVAVLDPPRPLSDEACEERALGPGSWEPELLETLYGLLHRVDAGSEALASGLEQLGVRYGTIVFTELIYLMSHLRFEPEEAREHWNSILRHRDRMGEKLGSTVDLRVAFVSYFLDVNRQLHNPKIIEMKLFERTRASAYRDELTGLHNYRLFREYLRQEVRRSDLCGTPLSLVMIDVDSFKFYNDRNGHEAGNAALSTIARLLQRELGKADFAARYGGEEFALILPSTAKVSAQLVAERCRESIEQNGFSHEESQPGRRLTVSIGVATFPADATEADELVRRADRAMYVAKSMGRNQVQLYGRSRRSFGRVDAELCGRLRQVAAESHPLTTVNLSEAGLAFTTAREVNTGAFLEIELDLPRAGRELRAAGRVVHVDHQDDSTYRVAVQFGDMSDADRVMLIEYTRERS